MLRILLQSGHRSAVALVRYRAGDRITAARNFKEVVVTSSAPNTVHFGDHVVANKEIGVGEELTREVKRKNSKNLLHHKRETRKICVVP